VLGRLRRPTHQRHLALLGGLLLHNYKAALGPEAYKPGGHVAGLSVEQLQAAWLKPFLPEADGGCPTQPEHAPWFATRSADVAHGQTHVEMVREEKEAVVGGKERDAATPTIVEEGQA
jgi:hypothetical protein